MITTTFRPHCRWHRADHCPQSLTVVPAHKLVDKPFRIARPQRLAALLSFLAYRFFVHRIDKRELAEFDTRGAARQIIPDLLLGAGLVFGVEGSLATLVVISTTAGCESGRKRGAEVKFAPDQYPPRA